MWYFVAPKVVVGQDALSHLAELKGKSAFIVTDKNVVRLGFVDKVKEHLSQAGIKAHVFDEVEPDPSLQTVEKGVAVMNKLGPDLIVAVGGGSVGCKGAYLDHAQAEGIRVSRLRRRG